MFWLLASFLASLLISLFLTPVAIVLARHWNILDNPGKHKTHSVPVPYLGGIAILLAVVLTSSSWLFVSSSRRGELIVEIVTIAVAASLLALLGLVDDIRQLAPRLRLMFEIVVGFVICIFAAAPQTELPSVLNILLGVVWFVGVINALNMLDHVDGLAAGTTAISATALAFISAGSGQLFVPVLCACLSGASLGFLKSNFHPARIYMGDSGAYFLGVLLAYAGIKVDTSLPREISFVIAPLSIALPLLDSLLVITTRIVAGRNPLLGGKDHSSHRLMRRGLGKVKTVSLLYAVSLFFALVAVVVSVLPSGEALFLLILTCLVAAAFLVLLFRIEPGYTSLD